MKVYPRDQEFFFARTDTNGDRNSYCSYVLHIRSPGEAFRKQIKRNFSNNFLFFSENVSEKRINLHSAAEATDILWAADEKNIVSANVPPIRKEEQVMRQRKRTCGHLSITCAPVTIIFSWARVKVYLLNFPIPPSKLQ